MALRARKPEAVTKRLKMLVYGPSGFGKTTAALQFKNAYVIDAERGTDNYEKLIEASGSVVFQTTDMGEVIQEVKALLAERHEYRTLVIDPITTLYNDLLEKCEHKVGTDFGKHIAEANKVMKRLMNLLTSLDMNVLIVAHAKPEYGNNMVILRQTFDGWKHLDYTMDLVLELTKKGKKRFAKVVKTRLESFPDEDVFEWSYEAFEKRYDPTVLQRTAATVELATPEQIREVKDLLTVVRLPEGTVEKWFAKAGCDVWEDMSRPVIEKCITYIKGRLNARGNGETYVDPSTSQVPAAAN